MIRIHTKKGALEDFWFRQWSGMSPRQKLDMLSYEQMQMRAGKSEIDASMFTAAALRDGLIEQFRVGVKT